PHDEAVVALLARTLHGTGRTAEAMRAVTRFRRRMVEETGLDASSQLARLEERILVDDPTLRGDAHHRREHAPGIEARPATAEWPRFQTPLHGREDELVRLSELIDAQQVVTLTGTGGIGKSRLACALADRRSAEG